MHIININPLNIRVGNLGTKPVLKYSTNTGVPNDTDITKNIKLIIPKKLSGLYSLNSFDIVASTLIPSEYVFNFDTDPLDLSLYIIGISCIIT